MKRPKQADEHAPPEALEALINAEATPLPGDRLQRLRDAVAVARAMEAEKADLEARLKEANIALYQMYNTFLPDLFDEVGIDSISLPPDGNLPGYDAKASPFYKANISADWPDDKRREGFAYLESIGFPDLIKTVITVPFSREMRASAVNLADELRSRGFYPIVAESVHNQTLTAWLREQVEKRRFLPNLDKIGGQVGRVVKLKQHKED